MRGYRIELGEIESQLRLHAGVREAVVVAREDEAGGGKGLVGYYVAEAGEGPGVESLRAHLMERLPEYMVPAAFVRLTALPLTANGKLDRKALPAPEGAAYARGEYEEPRGEVEAALALIWQQLLKVERVGRQDNFFELGGHSLLAVRLHDAIEALGYSVPIISLFQNPVLAALAARMEKESRQTGRSQDLVTFRSDGEDPPLFLVHQVEGNVVGLVYLAQRLDPGFPVYGLDLNDAAHVPNVEALAAYHLRRMRAVQPRGPYRIAGYSYGGLVAYEVARQLLGENESVTFLGLIDTYTPGALKRVNAGDDARQADIADPPSAKEHDLRRARVTRACTASIDRYHPDSIHMPVTLFQASASAPPHDPSLGWQQVLGAHLKSSPVEGHHVSMIQEPCVDDLARKMSSAIRQCNPDDPEPTADSRYRPAVTIRSTRDSRRVAFVLPGAGASVTCFLPFTDSLSIPVSVVGMQSRGIDGQHVPHSSVEAAATTYLEAILELAPAGPYRLLGHSFGGWLAFELARRLVSLDHRVSPVIMLDTEPPSRSLVHGVKYDRAATLKKYIRILEKSAGRSLNLRIEELRLLDAERQLQALLSAMKAAQIVPRSASTSLIRHCLKVFEAQLNIQYLPQGPLTADVYLLQTDDIDTDDDEWISPQEARERWCAWAPNLRAIRVPGDHMTMLEAPHIERTTSLVEEVWNVE